MIKAGEEEKSKHQSLRRGPQKTEERRHLSSVGGIMPAINILQMFLKQFELFLVQESWTAKTYIALSLGSRKILDVVEFG